MQKKQNPAARLRGAEVHLSRAMALRSWHHTTTSGLRKRTGVIITGGIDNQNLAGLLSDPRKTAGKSGGLVCHRNDNRNLSRVARRHLAPNLARSAAATSRFARDFQQPA
jgi:hypothetical protein